MNKNITIERIDGGYIVKDFETDITFLQLENVLKVIRYYYELGLSLEESWNKMFSELEDIDFDDDWYWG